MKDNKLLANYLGWTWIAAPKIWMVVGWYDYKGIWHSGRFDDDWNQLMLVVEKIHQENDEYYEVIIGNNRCYTESDEPIESSITSSLEDTTIKNVYKVCVAYVKSITK